MNLQENIQRIKEMMGIENPRLTLDFKKLLDDGIIFITQGHNLKTGERIKPEIDPQTGEMFDDSTNLITLHNLVKPEKGEQDGISVAMEHLRPDQIHWWQENQKDLIDQKYNQIIRSIELKGRDIQDYQL